MPNPLPSERLRSHSVADAELPELPDHVHATGAVPGASFASGSPAGGGFASFVLCATGFVLAAGGVALAAAPHFSWQLVRIGRELAALGLDNGVLVVGGLTLFALGLVHRAVMTAASAPTPHGESESAPLGAAIDELTTDLDLVRQSVLQVASEVQSLAQEQTSLHAELRDRHEQPAGTPAEPSTGSQHEAIFRLAASLDQLNARIDERMHGLDVQLRGHFQGVAEAVHESREAIDGRLRTLSAQVRARSVPVDLPSRPTAPPLSARAGRGEHSLEREPAPIGPDEPLEILVDLEDSPASPDQDLDESTLEFFATIEDLDQMVSGGKPPSSPATSRPAAPLHRGSPEAAPPALPDPAAGEDRLESLLPEESIRRHRPRT
ncbi:MAG: hypothetical protein AB1726_14945 [Planctomycetota bacterium]